MIQTQILIPGITLRCCRDPRFKQSCLSFQMVRPMTDTEAAMNALLPSVLLRGTRRFPNLRAITEHLDELYGAAVSPLVRRVGDCQTVGLYAAFLGDRFAMQGDRIFQPMLEFLEELLLQPLTENGVFSGEIVESEKKNLISTIASELNDKRNYAMSKLLEKMCAGDSFGLPRLGEAHQVAAITPEGLYQHYQKILRESEIQIFCVTAEAPETVGACLMPLAKKLGARDVPQIIQTPLREGSSSHTSEEMDVTQGKLCLGFTTPITNRCDEFAAMQLLNTVLGAGMTSKLFLQVREKQSLCYSINSGYYSTKGVFTVSAGIDFDKELPVREEIQRQLDACCRGEISDGELAAAKKAMCSSLQATHDSPGAMEGYYATAALSGLAMTPAVYRKTVEAVTCEQVASAARTLTLHSSFFLKGVEK